MDSMDEIASESVLNHACVWLSQAQRGDNRFVFRTDVKGYYAGIDYDLSVTMQAHHVPEERVLDV